MTWPIALAALFFIGAAMLLHASLVAPYRLHVTEVDAHIPALPGAFDGYVIAVLADVHHRPGLPLKHLARAVAVSNEANPDLVVLLGDYSVSFEKERRVSRWYYRRVLPLAAPLLRELRARDGVVAVLGNHDYYGDAPLTREWLAAAGIRVLVNECAIIERGGDRIAVVGLDDALEGEIDPRAGCDAAPADVPRIAISHNPDGVLEMAAEARVDLMLAGHTHGGQVIIPGLGAPVRHSRVCGWRSASGWVPNARGIPLYVSRGVGSMIPLRFFCPPEVVIVRLRRNSDAVGQQPA